jgi:hypothetical protein
MRNYFQDINQDKKLLALYYKSIGTQLFNNGKFKEGRKYLIKAFKENTSDREIPLAFLLSFFGSRIYAVARNSYQQFKMLFSSGRRENGY